MAFLAAACWLVLLTPFAAQAQVNVNNAPPANFFTNCANTAAAFYGLPVFQVTATPVPTMRVNLTAPVVYCVKYMVYVATVTLLDKLSIYMQATTAAIFSLALIIFSFRILGGEKDLTPRAAGFLLRMGIVLMLSYNLGSGAFLYPGGLVQAMFDLMDQLIGLAVKATGMPNNWAPWTQIDTFLGLLIGFGPNLMIFQGVLGIVAAALVSSKAAGITLFFAGLMALLNLILFILDIVYLYLSAVIVLAVQIILSPVIIPLALFSHTERYVKKWLGIVACAMLTPALIFGFLSMFMGLIVSCITGPSGIITLLGGVGANPPDFRAFWRSNQPLCSWVMNTEPNLAGQIADPGAQSIAPMLGASAPTLKHGFDACLLNVPTINFGPSHLIIMQELILSLVALWIFTSIMKSIVKSLPGVANSITGAVSGLTIDSMSVQQRYAQAIGNMKLGAGVVGAGAAIGAAGALMRGGGRARGLLTEMGGIFGAVAGRAGTALNSFTNTGNAAHVFGPGTAVRVGTRSGVISGAPRMSGGQHTYTIQLADGRMLRNIPGRFIRVDSTNR